MKLKSTVEEIIKNVTEKCKKTFLPYLSDGFYELQATDILQLVSSQNDELTVKI